MEVRNISSLYELKDYISNYSEEGFINALRCEQSKYEAEDYAKVKRMWLDWAKKRHGFIRYQIYKNWFLTRLPMRILHQVRHINNSALFYNHRVFFHEYKGLGYCRIDDCNISNFDNAARNIYYNIDNYINLCEQLGDKKSKEVLLAVLKCRLTRNIDCIIGISDNEDLQYFDDTILGKLNNEVFVDVGGYIGDTSEMLINKYNSVKKIYLYEPNTENLKVAKQILEKYSNIELELRPFAVSNTEAEVKLSKKESGSRIIYSETQDSNFDTEIITLITLDNDLKEKVTFIKMDIEGEEKNALEGAHRHIANDKPKLAICVYHKIDDLWQLPIQINRYNSDYKMYLRHYNKIGLSETVLYCIPR